GCLMSSDSERYVIGVDLGGTNIVVGAMTLDGEREITMRSEPTMPELGAVGVADRITGLIEDTIRLVMEREGANRDAFVGIGVGAPGPLDRARGIVVVAPNLGWRDFPLRDAIESRVGLPTTLDNDANCATLGEWWRGAARGSRHVVGVTIGTGIGGGIILNGRLHHGASDVAGEVGHTTIDSNGRRCKCGNYGCLEAYASGSAIAARAIEGVRSGEKSRLAEYTNGDLNAVTAQVVYQAAHDGDEYAQEVVRETAGFL